MAVRLHLPTSCPNLQELINVAISDEFDEHIEASPATLTFSESFSATGHVGMMMLMLITGAAGALALRKRAKT